MVRRDLERISREKYHVLAKTDGTRYIMFLVQYGEEFVVDMFERSGSHYTVSLAFDQKLFKGGTVFDGELVLKNDGKWEYQIFQLCLCSWFSFQTQTIL